MLKKYECYNGFLVILFFILIASCSRDSDINLKLKGSGDFTTSLDNATIEGTLFLPEGTGPFPVIIIVPGSGNEPREVSAPIAQAFNPTGYAIYIYDKRGIGGSTGSYPTETSDTQSEFLEARADDVVGIIETLSNHSDIDLNNLGLMGSSQGTWVSSITYDKSEDISFLILTNGGAAPTGYESYYDSVMLNNPDLTVEEGHTLLSEYEGDIGFDPREIFKTMDIPMLLVIGALDRSHPTLWEKQFITDLNNPNFTVQCYQNLDHELVDVHTGEIPEDLIPNILNWITQI